MTETEPVSELDLLAYADEQLDKDPQRRARVERYLAGAPEAAERIAAYRGQTEALRAAYGPRASESVPDRLNDVLRPAASRDRRRVIGIRAAAMVAMTAAAGLAGWYLGQESGPAQQIAEQRLPSVLREAAVDERARWRTLPMSVGGLGRGGALRWEENGVALSLPAPDLSAMGYALTGRRNFADGETQAVTLSYSGENGANLRLLIAPVTSGGAQTVAFTKAGGLRLAYWSQGPLTVAVQTDGEARDIGMLGRKIRDVIARRAPLQDRQPRELPPNKVEMTADAAGPQTPERAEQPATRTIIGTDTVIE
jgi:anti-sigma factor RsiW